MACLSTKQTFELSTVLAYFRKKGLLKMQYFATSNNGLYWPLNDCFLEHMKKLDK